MPRPRINAEPLTAAERSRRYREKRKGDVARFRARLKALVAHEEQATDLTIKKGAYVINKRGVTLKSKTLSFGQFQELAEDVAKIRKVLG